MTRGFPGALTNRQADGQKPGARRSSRALTLHNGVNCPDGCLLPRGQVEQVAESWAAKVPDRSSPTWPIDHVIALGGEVRPQAGPDRNLVVAERPDCFVVTETGAWPIAMALGHIALHLDHVEPDPAGEAILAVPADLPSNGPLSRARMEAVWFASAFLMPEVAVRDSWERNSRSLRRMAAEFRVPMALVASRTVRLKLSSARST